MDVLSSNTLRAALSTMKSIAGDKTVATLANYLRAKDPERAQKTEQIKATLENTLNALKASRVNVAAQRKAMAMQKLARVKAAIQALKMSVVTDPRIVARIAARLAKELAAAVKEYMAAGGTSAEIGSTTAPDSSTQTTHETTNETTDEATGTEAATATDEAVSVTISSDPKPSVPVPGVVPPAKPVEEENEPDQHSGDIWPQRPDKAVYAYEHAQKSGHDEDDSSSILDDARNDLKILRRMVRQARNYYSLLNPESKEATAAESVHKELDEAEKSIDKAMASVNGTA